MRGMFGAVDAIDAFGVAPFVGGAGALIDPFPAKGFVFGDEGPEFGGVNVFWGCSHWIAGSEVRLVRDHVRLELVPLLPVPLESTPIREGKG